MPLSIKKSVKVDLHPGIEAKVASEIRFSTSSIKLAYRLAAFIEQPPKRAFVYN